MKTEKGQAGEFPKRPVLLALLVLCLLAAWFLISHFRGHSLGTARRGGDLPESNPTHRESWDSAHQKLPAPRRDADRQCHDILLRTAESLQRLENERIVDRSSALHQLMVTDSIRKSFQVPEGTNSLGLENAYVVVRAPTGDECSAIRDQVRNASAAAPFRTPAERDTAEVQILKQFLNYPSALKLVIINSPVLKNPGPSDTWVTAYNTNQVMEMEGESGTTLSSKDFRGHENIEGRREGSRRRYGHLFGID